MYVSPKLLNHLPSAVGQTTNPTTPIIREMIQAEIGICHDSTADFSRGKVEAGETSTVAMRSSVRVL